MKRIFLLISIAIVYGLFSMIVAQAYAKDKELTLIYTGETHAMLYHCLCPIEADGGVSRRTTLIKQLRKQYPDLLLLDSGSFFGGGSLDSNTQNTQLDMQRSLINLRAMELMRYDAVLISDDEFNFGKDFLNENISKAKLNFISANLKSQNLAPYIIKEIAGLKVGIIGATNLAAQQKTGGLNVAEPRSVIESSVADLKKKGVKLIILLSNLGELEDLKLIGDIPGIDVVIDARKRVKNESFTRLGNVLFLRPSWEGRRLGLATLSIKNDKIGNVNVEDIRLSDKISEDQEVRVILPRCFSDNECKKEGLLGTCQNAGNISASCMFSEAAKINLTVVTSKECAFCNTKPVVNFLKKQFPGLEVSYLYYPDKKAVKFIEDLKATGLPVYLIGKEVAKDKNFDNLKANLEETKDFYMLKPEVSGVAYFFNRLKVKGKLDLFLSLYDKDSAQLLNMIKEFNPVLHFLVIPRDDKIDAALGAPEAEEDLRSVCVQKYYPDKFWNYIVCRAKNINSSWWDDCLSGVDTNKIKLCSRGDEGRLLLKENSGLSNELKIMFGPTYLLDNQEIFASKGVPSKEEFKKAIKR